VRYPLIIDPPRNTNRIEAKLNSAKEWLEIWESGRVYYDGERTLGYGGYFYDGRWHNVVENIIQKYQLNKNDTLLDIGCAKGFLVNDFNNNKKVGCAKGLDISMYALLEGLNVGMKGDFVCGNAINLPFENKEFSLVFSKDTLHNILNRSELIQALKEIERVGINSWIRVGAYENEKQKEVLDKWATFATSYFHVDDWYRIFREANFTGDFDWFHPTEYING
jgi:hypothetical protein